MGLCQDTELVVRSAMCDALGRIALAVGPALACERPLSEWLELTSDEHPEVRAAAFGCGVTMLDACDVHHCRETLEPATRRTVASCVDVVVDGGGGDGSHELLLSRVAEKLPALLDALSSCGYFDAPARDEHAAPNGSSIYERLVLCLARGTVSAELRAAGAQALPALAAALARAQGGDATARLLPCVRSLSDDESPLVRLAFAEALPPFALALGPPLAPLQALPAILGVLERAEPAEVTPVLRALPDLLNVLSGGGGGGGNGDGGGPSSHAAVAVQLLPMLLQLEGPLGGSARWRASLELIGAYACLADALEPQSLYSLCIPSLFGHLTAEAAAPNRREAVRVICLMLRKLRTQGQRSDVCARLVRELAGADSYCLRVDFLHTCSLLLDPSPPCGCSHRFFKAHSLHHAMLSLAADPVPNVRLRLCALLPPLKRTLRLPTDADALQRLHHAVVQLQSDGARDVQRSATLAEGALRQFDMLMEGAPLRRTAGGDERWWEAEDARAREEEALVSAEHEANAGAKRRAADELAERARAAYTTKLTAETGRRTGTDRDSRDSHDGGGFLGGGRDHHNGGGSGRSSRNHSREIPPHALPRISAASGGGGGGGGSSSGGGSGSLGAGSPSRNASLAAAALASPWASGTRAANPYPTGPGTGTGTGVGGSGGAPSSLGARGTAANARRSSRDSLAASVEGSGVGTARPRRQSGDALSTPSSGFGAAAAARSRRQTHG